MTSLPVLALHLIAEKFARVFWFPRYYFDLVTK